MPEIIVFAMVLVPIITGLVEVVKKTVSTPINLIPLIAVVLGLLVGGLYTYTELTLTSRLWAGLLAGMAATGLFELIKQREGYSKEDEPKW